MPCRWSRRCRAAPAAESDVVPASTESPEMEDWKRVRRGLLKNMRRQVRFVVLLMATIEAIRVGPLHMVYAGRHGFPDAGEEAFGIAYTAGYILSWLYFCAFMIVWVPLFSWWIPLDKADTSDDSLLKKTADFFKNVDMILFPLSIGICLFRYLFYVIQTFIYVESRPIGSNKMPKNTRKNWVVRFFLLLGILISTTCGYFSFNILEQADLARVKTLEYAVIVVPIQINIGIIFGTIMQFKMEKRIAMKKQKALEMAKNEEAMIGDEKTPLIEV